MWDNKHKSEKLSLFGWGIYKSARFVVCDKKR